MMPELMDVLGKLKDRDEFTGDDDLVFCSQVGDHLDPFALRRRYYRVLEQLACGASVSMTAPRIRIGGDHEARSVRGPVLHGTPALLPTQRYLHHKPRREDAAALQEAFRRPASSTVSQSRDAAPESLEALGREQSSRAA